MKWQSLFSGKNITDHLLNLPIEWFCSLYHTSLHKLSRSAPVYQSVCLARSSIHTPDSSMFFVYNFKISSLAYNFKEIKILITENKNLNKDQHNM